MKTLPYYFQSVMFNCAIASPTHLLLSGKEERIRVHAICDGIANHGQPVEDQRRLIGVLEQQLLQDIENDGKQDKGGEAGGGDDGRGRVGGKVAHGAGNIGEETHNARQEATTEVKVLSKGNVDGERASINFPRVEDAHGPRYPIIQMSPLCRTGRYPTGLSVSRAWQGRRADLSAPAHRREWHH